MDALRAELDAQKARTQELKERSGQGKRKFMRRGESSSETFATFYLPHHKFALTKGDIQIEERREQEAKRQVDPQRTKSSSFVSGGGSDELNVCTEPN